MGDVCRLYANTIPSYIRNLKIHGIRGGSGTSPPWVLREDCRWDILLKIKSPFQLPESSDELINTKKAFTDFHILTSSMTMSQATAVVYFPSQIDPGTLYLLLGFCFCFCFCFFWPRPAACGIRDWIQVTAVKAQSPKHWTTREFPEPGTLEGVLQSMAGVLIAQKVFPSPFPAPNRPPKILAADQSNENYHPFLLKKLKVC